MEITKAVKVALNTLVDIASHSGDGRLVPVPEISKRIHISISRIELLLRPLRESGLVVGIKGRTGGYQLLKDPRLITLKDIALAINRIQKRKIEASDIAKDFYQSLETYMVNYISNASLTSSIKEYIPRFGDLRSAPERRSSFSSEPEIVKKQLKPSKVKAKGETQQVVKTVFKKVDEIPKGPNSIFNLADYLNKNSQAN